MACQQYLSHAVGASFTRTSPHRRIAHSTIQLIRAVTFSLSVESNRRSQSRGRSKIVLHVRVWGKGKYTWPSLGLIHGTERLNWFPFEGSA